VKLRLLVVMLLKICFMESSPIPVIFVHSNDADYLENTLSQAKQYNEVVILLGDDTNKHHAKDGILYYPIADYYKSSTDFKTIYRHMTQLPYDFEFACFSRWFIFDEFMKAHNIPVAFYCDSDVMLYCDISKEYESNFKQYDMSAFRIDDTWVMMSYWSSQAISSFCSFLTSFYGNTEQISKIEQEFKNGGKWYHDDCPMTGLFVEEYKDIYKIGHLGQIIDNATFDPVVWYSYQTYDRSRNSWFYQCQMVNKDVGDGKTLHLKDITWGRNLPYCFNLDLNTFIRLKALHFQGDHKKLIKDYRK